MGLYAPRESTSTMSSMFTGIVEAVGNVVRLQKRGPGLRMTVDAGRTAEGVRLGDSVAINGCCLTVVEVAGCLLSFDAGEETLSRTNLGRLHQASRVNLERSLQVGDRLGGHLVTGHIDGAGELVRRDDQADWSSFWFRFPAELRGQLASKGSVTVDGVSLTLVEVLVDRFSVALIPHTLQVTTLGERQVGDRVNLETDVLAKYVEQALLHHRKQA